MKNVTPKISVSSDLVLPASFLQDLNEKRHHLKAAEELIPKVLKSLEHQSSELYLSGILELGLATNDKKDVWQIPVISRFLFTCSNELSMDEDWLVCLN